MMALIQRKIEGEDISVAPTEKPEHKIIDLMEALKASLNATDKRKPAKRTDAKTADAKGTDAKSAAKATSRKTARKKRAS
jgi:non-homologous end joining protein Ku